MLKFDVPEILAANNQIPIFDQPTLQFSLAFEINKRISSVSDVEDAGIEDNGINRLNSRQNQTDFRGVVLQFERLIGHGLVPAIDVYLNLPSSSPSNKQEKSLHYAGTLALYGLQASSTPSFSHAGQGLLVNLEITEVFNYLRTLPTWDETQLLVMLSPRRPFKQGSDLTIGRCCLILE